MSRNASAYRTLGLAPGADEAAVDEAYRRLIKKFHPDREGGDAGRAAEINWAYSQLRRKPAMDSSQSRTARAHAVVRRHRAALRPRRSSGPLAALVVIAAAGGLIASRDQIAGGPDRWAEMILGPWSPDLDYRTPVRVEPTADPLEADLAAGDIDRSIRAAQALVERRNEAAIEERSRDCHRRLRDDPSASALDGCAAFDFAVVTLKRADPLRDEGPFSATAVTARQMSAAQTLSDDYPLIESRLDRVRTRVEASLLPPRVVMIEYGSSRP